MVVYTWVGRSPIVSPGVPNFTFELDTSFVRVIHQQSLDVRQGGVDFCSKHLNGGVIGVKIDFFLLVTSSDIGIFSYTRIL